MNLIMLGNHYLALSNGLPFSAKKKHYDQKFHTKSQITHFLAILQNFLKFKNASEKSLEKQNFPYLKEVSLQVRALDVSECAHSRAGASRDYSDVSFFLFEMHTFINSFFHKLITDSHPVVQLIASCQEAGAEPSWSVRI